MKNGKVLLGSAVLLFLLGPGVAMAQQPAAGGGPTSPPTRIGRQGHPGANHREACLKQAGVTRQQIEQRRSIEQGARSQVEGVCNDSSLSPQQKREKIRDIRQSARKQVEGIIPADKLEQIRQCEHPGGAGGHMGGHGGGMHEGPCGGRLGEPPAKPAQ